MINVQAKIKTFLLMLLLDNSEKKAEYVAIQNETIK